MPSPLLSPSQEQHTLTVCTLQISHYLRISMPAGNKRYRNRTKFCLHCFCLQWCLIHNKAADQLNKNHNMCFFKALIKLEKVVLFLSIRIWRLFQCESVAVVYCTVVVNKKKVHFSVFLGYRKAKRVMFPDHITSPAVAHQKRR